MGLQPILISGYNSGLTKNKKPFLLIDDAFQELINVYTWRERIKKREGIKLVGRLRRCITVAVTLANQADGDTYLVTDIFADAAFLLRATEPNAEIEPGGVTIVVGGLSFTDSASDGILVEAGSSTGTINYASGRLDLAFDPALGGLTNVDVTFCYFPALPAMGIGKRELAAINVEQTVWFDTKYVYSYDTNNFSSTSSTTWSGSNSDFFWMANFRGATPDVRLFFATNNTTPSVNANNRIRHTTDLATWTNFIPAVSGTQFTNEVLTSGGVGVVTPFETFTATIANTPIIPGSVTITVENTVSPIVDPIVGFRDQLGTYPAGTLIGSPSTNSGVIDYSTGEITLNFTPSLTRNSTVTVTYQQETSFLFQARIIIPYYGRLLALNVFEGPNASGATNIFNRCRFSQVGNPLQRDAWISSIPGKGGFIDAPTNESIVSARFYKNTLIVAFERSTWQLRYVGDFSLPFLWERISSDFGSESTFSTVLFDDGVLAVGDKAIVASSGNNIERIDLDIPDTVFEFNNRDNGKERVHGIRDFFKELVYWTYSEGGIRRTFPNRVLLYNYRNNTYAIFRDNVTVFGELTTPTGMLWDLETPWDGDTSWDKSLPAEFPTIISGNQQGWIHWYQYPDAETTADADTNTNEHESLSITGITLSNTLSISLEVINHNLEAGEIIFITNLLFANPTTDTTVTTNLNDRFYRIVTRTDANNIILEQWNFTTQQYESTSHNEIAFTPDPDNSDTYMGGGQVALIQNISIITKDFNPYIDLGSQIKMSYVDFMTDSTPNSAISVDVIIDSANNPDYKSNIEVGNQQTGTANHQFGRVTNITQATLALVTAPHHGLQTGQTIDFKDVGGMTQVSNLPFTITHVDENSYTLNVDSSGFTAYTSGGQWISNDNRFYLPGSLYAWRRFYATCFGQYIAFRLYFDSNLMNTIDIHQSGFEMNAMKIWTRRGGRTIS